MDFSSFKADRHLWWREFQWQLDHVLKFIVPFSWIHKFKWWLKYRFHPSHRYTIIDTRLKPGYYDRDWILLNASFAILCDFVEKELPWTALYSDEEKNKIPWYMPTALYIRQNAERLAFLHLDWKMESRTKSLDTGEPDLSGDLEINHENTWGWSAKEIKELYIWWKYGRAIEHQYDGYDFDKECALDDKDDSQLIRLIKIRNFMWT